MRADHSFAAVTGLGAALTLFVCGLGGPAPPDAEHESAPRLVAAGSAAPAAGTFGFADCEAMARQMREAAGVRVDEVLESGAYYDGVYGPIAGGDSMLSGLSLGGDPVPPARIPAVGTGPTGTNVVERGVDEPDIAKVDGTRLLRLWGHENRADRDDPVGHTALAGWELTILDLAGATPRRLGALRPVTEVDAVEMLLLDDHRVLVIGSVQEGSPREGDDELWTPKVVLMLVDTADAAAPKILRTAKLTGTYVTGRLHDGVVRVVFATPPPLRVTPPMSSREGMERAAARNRAVIAGYADRNWLPVREILDTDGRLVASGPAMDCSAVHPPPVATGPDLLSVLTLDTRTGPQALDRAGVRALLGGADTVYASPGRLYAAAHRWVPGTARQAGDGSEEVTVHAFGLSGRRDSPYAGSATVPGRLLDSSALSEHRGHLRVALTEGDDGDDDEEGRPARSGVVVFAPDAGRLRQVGRLSGLGPGEEIRSVRWAGDLATVVTFRRTDPFYVLDLSRPTAPRLLGELEIPGYSGYLHPVGGGIVLGVGQDGDERGNLAGAQVSAFDVADPTQPTRRGVLDFGGGELHAEADSRAFTYLPDRQTAVVIGSLPAGRRTAPTAVAVGVDRGGRLRELGRFRADARVLRVLPVGDRLAAVTVDSVTLLDPADLRPTGSLVLDPSYEDDGGHEIRPRPRPRPRPSGVSWVAD